MSRISIADDLGPRLRARREERGISLRELARRVRISPSALSQFETGKSRPSVSTLYALVSELGASLDELFSGVETVPAEPPPPSGARAGGSPADDRAQPAGRHMQPAGERVGIDLETGVRWERLTSQPDAEADFLYVVYDVGGSSCQGDRFIRHPGREYGLVLSGVLEVTVGFDTYELGPGDSISFDSTVPHCLRTIGDEPVHGVWFVIGRQGDPRSSGLDAQAPESAAS